MLKAGQATITFDTLYQNHAIRLDAWSRILWRMAQEGIAAGLYKSELENAARNLNYLTVRYVGAVRNKTDIVKLTQMFHTMMSWFTSILNNYISRGKLDTLLQSNRINQQYYRYIIKLLRDMRVSMLYLMQQNAKVSTTPVAAPPTI